MTREQEAGLLAYLAAIAPAPKSFDSIASWRVIQDRTSPILECLVSLKIDGVARGVRARFRTPQALWEQEAYAQIEVVSPLVRGALRIMPIEWRPRRSHRNPAAAPDHLRLLTLTDRWHPTPENLPLGIGVFAQYDVGIAAPLPRAIATFEDYLALCAELWNCPDALHVPNPPWTPGMEL